MYEKVNVDETDEMDADGLSATIRSVGYELKPDNMRANVWQIDAGETMPMHRQTEQEELYFVLEGTGEMQVEDETFPLRAGDVVVVPPESWRQFVATEAIDVFVVGAPNARDDGIMPTDIPADRLE